VTAEILIGATAICVSVIGAAWSISLKQAVSSAVLAERISRLGTDIDKYRVEVKEDAARREARVGKVEDAMAVLYRFMDKLDGAKEERHRRDTRGVPINEEGES
jgi:hypothetical protein